MRAPRRLFTVGTLAATAVLAAAVGTAGCSSTSKQTQDRQQATQQESASADRDEQSGRSSASDDDRATAGGEERLEISMEKLIGAETTSGLPRGCPDEWSTLEGRSFDGELFACDDFSAPKRYREPTVVVGVAEETIRRVSLQAFYESADAVQSVYDEVVDEYQQRCERFDGGSKRMVLDCGEFILDVSYRKETGSIRLIYGLENWDMPD